MQRICRTLAEAGYRVTLVGRRLPSSPPLSAEPYRQQRLRCLFHKGSLFYFEYQARLLVRLLAEPVDILCAVDLDTALPCYAVSVIKGAKRAMDAHELFTEMKEVVTRPRIRSIWKSVERFAITRFPKGYTVSGHIAEHLRNEYGVDYRVVRNMSVYREGGKAGVPGGYILYQGAVNEGRCFEWLLPAMLEVRAPLLVYGDGNLLDWVRDRILELGLQDKVFLMGKREPAELREVTARALIGVNLVEDRGLSNRYSLSNKFFDYVHAGIPQVCSDLPAYHELNERFRVALMVEGSDPSRIAEALNNLLDDGVLYTELGHNCSLAARAWNWQEEQKVLLGFYGNL